MSALISECGNYRYYLTRAIVDRPPEQVAPLVFVMLNPSTADAELDDATIRRLKGFAKSWRAPGLMVVNLFAYRATEPKKMLQALDPIGPDNDDWIRYAGKIASKVVVAWGANGPTDRVHEVVSILRECHNAPLYCLGVTQSGSPRHPLYVKSDQILIEWEGK